jgi:hypothetical protein
MLEVGLCSSLYSQNLTRVVQWCSNLVIVLAREGAEVHLHALQSITEQFQLWEWGHCHLRKPHHCLEIMSGSGDALQYPTCLAVIQPCRVIMWPAEYYTMILLSRPLQNLLHVSLLEPGIPNCRLPWVFSKRKLLLMETAWRMTHLTIWHAHFQLYGAHVLWSWYCHLRIWALLSVIRGLAIAALPWICEAHVRQFLWKQGL